MTGRVEIHPGDCLEVLATLPENSVEAIVTDPPYGIDYQSARRTDKSTWKPKIANDKEPFTTWIPGAYKILKDGGCLVCFTRWDTEGTFRQELEGGGFILKSQIIWDKVIHGMGDLRGDFAPCHENIIFATKGRYVFPGKRPKSVIRVKRVTADKLLHPNEKPVDLFLYLIEHLTTAGQSILDPFMGSGASAVAAFQLGRDYIGIELNPEYVEMSRKRIEAEQQQPLLEII